MFIFTPFYMCNVFSLLYFRGRDWEGDGEVTGTDFALGHITMVHAGLTGMTGFRSVFYFPYIAPVSRSLMSLEDSDRTA